MTVHVVAIALAIACGVGVILCLGMDWWTRRAQPPGGRHRATATPVPSLSATRMLTEAMRADDELPELPRPTREQLRQEAAR